MSDNSITVVGNVTQEPELKFLNSGAATARFSLAVNRKWKNRAGEQEESVSFFNVDCIGTLAENVANSLHKGTRVIVTGRLEQRSWDTDEGKRSIIEIKAEAVGPDLRFAVATVNKVEQRTAEVEEAF